MIKKSLFILGLLLGNTGLQAIVAVGDTVGAPTTFQFSVGSAIFDASKQQLWTLSGEDISSFSSEIQSYGIAYTPFVSIDGSLNPKLTAYPYISAQAAITSTNEQGEFVAPTEFVPNPLLGKSFSAVTFVGSYLTVALAASPRYVYLIQSVFFNDGASLGKTSSEGLSVLNVLDLGVLEQVAYLAGSGLGVLFTAQTQGVFGTDASSIAFATTTTTNYAEINGQRSACVVLAQQAQEPITVSTPVLVAGGNNLSSIGSSVFISPLPLATTQMYVGLDVTANSGSNDQAVAFFIVDQQAPVNETPAAVVFSSVIPDVVAQQGLLTPISANASQRVVVSNITTTQTSTGLSYIITARSNNADQQFMYAMPMVTMATDSANNGKVGSFNSVEQVFEIKGSVYRAQGFSSVIDDANEIDIAGSATVVNRIRIGGGPVPLGAGQYIEQLQAQGDAVYITIHQDFSVGTTPGMFKSQALFDAQGRIMSWSPWQRVAGTDDQMLFAAKNRFTDATMYISGTDSKTVQQTTWNSTTVLTSFLADVTTALPFVKGGVQGIIPVSNETPDLSNFTLAIATGNQAVIVGQTGRVDTNGNLIIDNSENILVNADQNLNIGSVVTATFAHDSGTSNNWFFMGGDSGLAVLSNDTTGITFNGELTTLNQLTASGSSCKTLGNFKFIKKLVSSGSYLYILTTTGVYRIALVATKFKLTNPSDLNIQTVVKSSTIDKYASCLDMLIDNNLMLLGTTNGLYTVNLAGSLPASPVSIEIPGGLAAVSRLNTISSQANFNEAFYDRSNLYVLTVNYAVQQACLNRFTIHDGIVEPIQDQLLQGQNGPLLVFNFMSNNIFIDGSFGFATCYKIGNIPASIKYLESTLQAGRSSTQSLLDNHTANLSIAPVLNSLGIAGITRDYASGCLMLGADFGILTDSSN
ncbi:hypothetical protein KBC04_00035 [Candidatus Babeliales bacterium]|nr:hypothetical protein [Candidatus Babeliales bacterium]MBP9843518.1 hypothetical protein [Candidatus Babeliales bacterium]